MRSYSAHHTMVTPMLEKPMLFATTIIYNTQFYEGLTQSCALSQFLYELAVLDRPISKLSS